MSDLHILFVRGLREILDGEHLLVKGLSEVELCADTKKFKAAVMVHLAQTKHHITRLEKVFKQIGDSVDRTPCKGIEGIIDEAELLVQEFRNNSALDAALIAAAQKAEHYEIAAYGCLCAWAKQLGYDTAFTLLEANLAEEKQTDKLLTALAEWFRNPAAKRHDTEKVPERAAELGKAVAFGG